MKVNNALCRKVVSTFLNTFKGAEKHSINFVFNTIYGKDNRGMFLVGFNVTDNGIITFLPKIYLV